MSGSDSGPSNWANDTFGGASEPCDSLAYETVLSSPKPNIISNLTLGDVLDIEINVINNIETLVALYNGNIAGGLVQHSDHIKDCIEKGFKYSAEVRVINGAQITVFVTSV